MRRAERPARSRALLLVAWIAWVGCAHEVVQVDGDPPPLEPPSSPLALTLAVQPGSFERSGLNPAGILDHFAGELRRSGIVQGVMYPVPQGAEPRWEIELTASDGGTEPDANLWRAALAQALPPLAFVIYLQNDYTLELQALLVRDRELVGTYRATSTIRHRYQVHADRDAMRLEGLDRLARQATRKILAALAADAPRIAASDP